MPLVLLIYFKLLANYRHDIADLHAENVLKP